ncbi:MAG TPA: DNA-3-methyladenine glycosylase, partial [Niallia sp.]|nr:DNA-3-methyladenine glycosylase [Niallia sp.]
MIDYIHQSTEEIARQLLGKILIHKTPTRFYSGYIVETEAYLGIEDMACHSYAGRRTPRLESMYKLGGTIYIYTMHTHQMLNIVTKKAGDPQAVLIRAIEPIDGLEWMERNRKTTGLTVCNGPGKLTKAMEITKILDGDVINKSSLL